MAGAEAVILGRSQIVGRPLAALLLAADCTVTIAHSKSRDVQAICRRADILIAASGQPAMVEADWIKPGATVIDVGTNRVVGPDGAAKLVGDVDFAAARQIAGAITPVPGGVGPMTIACLLRNTIVAACRRRGLADPLLLAG
jgi:methylenetetrahydrofolate dehydrogenase (NADP+)/methenyltetrahydrofolate cyclohydrolase